MAAVLAGFVLFSLFVGTLPTAAVLPLTLLSGALIGAGAWILVRMKRSK